jgi:3-hydroxyisobutyrate dehydrogenase
MTDTVTFIGLGTMGQPMVRNLAHTVPVAAYDIAPKADAGRASRRRAGGRRDPHAAQQLRRRPGPR